MLIKIKLSNLIIILPSLLSSKKMLRLCKWLGNWGALRQIPPLPGREGSWCDSRFAQLERLRSYYSRVAYQFQHKGKMKIKLSNATVQIRFVLRKNVISHRKNHGSKQFVTLRNSYSIPSPPPFPKSLYLESEVRLRKFIIVLGVGREWGSRTLTTMRENNETHSNFYHSL